MDTKAENIKLAVAREIVLDRWYTVGRGHHGGYRIVCRELDGREIRTFKSRSLPKVEGELNHFLKSAASI